VELYRTPPDPVFYDVIYHSYGIVPALANPAYYACKLTSAVITTLMTGVALGVQAALQGCLCCSSSSVVVLAAPYPLCLHSGCYTRRRPPHTPCCCSFAVLCNAAACTLTP
jgi:hypothetical protein